MQDKEILDEAEEVLTTKTETSSTCSDLKDSSEEKKDTSEVQAKKEHHKDRSVFRKKRQTKKDRAADKSSPSRFFGDGVNFKAKLIGVETVSDARGDKMCQEAMTKLKVNVRNMGPHKRKIIISVSLKGIKIRDEKTGELLYHHSVPFISFISQDISDARAFGYIFGLGDGQHQFIAIKTEKPAFHVVIALRDLFQTVLNWKKEIQDVEQRKSSLTESEGTENDAQETKGEAKETVTNVEQDNIHFEVFLPPELRDPFMAMEEVTEKEPVKTVETVDDLLGLQDELEKLQQGIDQMDTSIAEATVNFEKTAPEKDPFDTSFVLGPKDAFHALSTPVPLTSSSPNGRSYSAITADQSTNGDKYAAFSALDSGLSVFGNAAADAFTEDPASQHVPDIQELEEEILRKSNVPPPPKPPRRSKSPPPDLSVFADLDPLGKDRPYKDKTEFFQDVKNPPKKVLNDLVDKNSGSGDETVSKVFDTNFGSPPSMFPNGFEALSHAHPASIPPRISTISTSLPNAFSNQCKLSVPFPVSGNVNNPYNPFESNDQTDTHKTLLSNGVANVSYLGKPPRPRAATQQQFTVSHSVESSDFVQSQSTLSSSPIPIPTRQQPVIQKKDRSLSTGSIASSLYSRSPVSFISESPTQMDYFGQNISDIDGNNIAGIFYKNLNTDDVPMLSPVANNGVCSPDRSTPSPSSKSSMNHNGVSRPRPRPSSSKAMSMHNNGLHSSFQPATVPSAENEVISKENMQSIANMLLTNGHRLRKNSLPVPSHRNYDVQVEKTIFTKKSDPFADDFFCSLPKKVNGHITEIQDCI